MTSDHTASSGGVESLAPVICFSHLRWRAVYQRPQHLMSRLARQRRVIFVEEPLFGEQPTHLEVQRKSASLSVLTPTLDARLARDPEAAAGAVQQLLQAYIAAECVVRPVVWYDTPLALRYGAGLPAEMVVYDCADGLPPFGAGPSQLREHARRLLSSANLVLVSSRSAFEATRRLHPNIHFLPNSVEADHFSAVCSTAGEPPDQDVIAHPRVGFAGVIDERVDLQLLAAVARMRARLQFVLTGPVINLDPETLPRAPNIHYLGAKTYAELPRYMHGWDAAVLPFVRTLATLSFNPNRAAELLAAGLPVVATSLPEVVRPYGQLGLVRIADEPVAFAQALSQALGADRHKHRSAAQAYLRSTSWEQTVARIGVLLGDAGRGRTGRAHRIGRAHMG